MRSSENSASLFLGSQLTVFKPNHLPDLFLSFSFFGEGVTYIEFLNNSKCFTTGQALTDQLSVDPATPLC